MRRREFITLVGGAAVSWPITSHAQQSDKTRLIGVLISYPESDRTGRSEVAVFRGGLAKLGWTEGSNLRIELRWGNSDPDRIRTLAKELIDLRPDVILSQSTVVTGALARETRTIRCPLLTQSGHLGPSGPVVSIGTMRRTDFGPHDEATRIYYLYWCCGLSDRRSRATASKTGDRVSRNRVCRSSGRARASLSAGPERNRIRGRPECDYRVSVGRRPK